MRFFLYGTLMQGSDTAMARWLGDRLDACEPGSVPGRMIAVRSATGWFPAILPRSGAQGGRVQGMVGEARLAPGELAVLDRYEGVEYRRAVMRVQTASGHCTAQAWIWRFAPPPGSMPVPSGDFRAWLAQNGEPILRSRNGR